MKEENVNNQTEKATNNPPNMSDFVIVDTGFKEVLKNLKHTGFEKMSDSDIKKLEEGFVKDFQLDAKLAEIDLKCDKKRVVYVDGENILIYDNGEFFLEDTIDSKKNKKKIARKKAIEMYIEYFVKYTLTPTMEHKKMEKLTQEILKTNKVKEQKQIESKKLKEKTIEIEEKNINKER